MKRKINLILLVLLVVVIFTGCMEEEEPVLITFGDTGVTMWSDYYWGGPVSSDYITVKGEIINSGDRDYRYFEVWAKFYDYKGYVVKKDYTNFVDFNAGEKRKFEIYTYLPNSSIDDVEIYVKYRE